MADLNQGYDQSAYGWNEEPTYNANSRGRFMAMNRGRGTAYMGAGRGAYGDSSWPMSDEQSLLQKPPMEGNSYKSYQHHGGRFAPQNSGYGRGSNYRSYMGAGTNSNQSTGYGRGSYYGSYMAKGNNPHQASDYGRESYYGSYMAKGNNSNQESYMSDGYAAQDYYGSSSYMDDQIRQFYDAGGDYSSYNVAPSRGNFSMQEYEKSQDDQPQQNEPAEDAGLTELRKKAGQGPCTLYICGMSRTTTEETIRTHFQDFGTVVGVECETRFEVEKGTLKGNVTFEDASVAEAAYLHPRHFLNCVRVDVSPFSTFWDVENNSSAKKKIKLFVRGFGLDVSEGVLRKYFSRFGDVLKVFIDKFMLKVNARRSIPAANGRIFYKRLHVDMRVILNERHWIGRNRLQLSDTPFRKLDNPLSGLRKSEAQREWSLMQGSIREMVARKFRPGVERLALKSFNKVERRCRTFPQDPHDVCVFCRGLGIGSFSPCYSVRECERCFEINRSVRSQLRWHWVAQSKDMDHPCYWNMTPVHVFLEPANVTADTYYCTICSMTLSRSQQEMVFHLLSERHKKSAETRHEVMVKMQVRLRKLRLEAEAEYIKNDHIMKFCFVCLMTFSTRTKRKAHEKSEFHLVSRQLRMRPCHTCGIEQFYKQTLAHTYRETHLRNIWHDLIMAGDAEPSHTLPSHGLTGLSGADMIRDQGAGYCDACAVFFPNKDDGSLFDHCKTKEHFENYKLVLKGEKIPVKQAERCIDDLKEGESIENVEEELVMETQE